MTSSGLPQGFSIFQPTLGDPLQFFPAVGSQELDELIHAHLVGPASSQEKRTTLALDFLDHAQRTGQTFKFYPVYTVGASPATSVSSLNTSPTTSSWDWNQTSRTASISSRSSQNRVSKATSPASRVRATDFAGLPGMKIMTKDGLDVTNSASRGSKTKEQRDHAHLMRIIKACDSCKRKKIRCDPSHKKRGAVTPATPAAAAAKVTKKARTPSPSAASQSISPPQSASSQSVSPEVTLEDFSSFSTCLFDTNLPFTFDTLDTFDSTLAAPTDLWGEFIQYPPVDQPEDYDFFADPESFLSSQSSDADLSAARISIPASSPRSGAPPGRGPDAGSSEYYAGLLDGADMVASLSQSAQLPYDLQDSAGDYTDFNLYSPRSTFSEDERMLDIGSSSSGLSTQGMPSPVDSPRRPPNPGSPDLGTDIANAGDVATQPPFTRAEETEPSERTDVQDAIADGTARAISVLSRSDVVMRTNEQGQLIICCPPGTVVVNSNGQRSTDSGLMNVSTVYDSSSSSLGIPPELSESAVASVSARSGDVDSVVSTWLDHQPLVARNMATEHGSLDRSDDRASPLDLAIAAPTRSSPTQVIDAAEDAQSSSSLVQGNLNLPQTSSNESEDSYDISTGAPSNPVPLENTLRLRSAGGNNGLEASSNSIRLSNPQILRFDANDGYIANESGSLLSSCLPGGPAAASALPVSGQESFSITNDFESSDLGNTPSKSDDSHRSVDLSQHQSTTQTAASTVPQRYAAAGVGRSLQDCDAQNSVSTADLAALMQAALTRTLLVAAYAQLAASASASTDIICSRALSAHSYTPLACVPAVC
ncbi:hypothetical protein ISF_08883 [Cordyceps fumosorosea ARSEF 2679]|uniref:Transcription factor Cys6 n=1 Tax=Cordyceps fumosorosea (strain ARSEF 2679) TaxID=1081104 RepID=A0A167LMQ1_CORFA|nr:hypothetical protein ISF_08883 [Cordyceps fumosorosea ARSEF 2679]OAA53269.1 hypothetical protein ISF_08883 [Cordyceps fumosorosea ARSEF 2679]